jgi:heme exporter protein D
MGGYALYVWCSFGVCVLVMFIEPASIRIRRKAIIKRLQQERLAEQFDKEGRQ